MDINDINIKDNIKDVKLGFVILCKDEGYMLANCIKNNNLADMGNVVVINSSDIGDGSILEIERGICSNMGVEMIEKRIGDKGINGIADLRNFGNIVLSNKGIEWALHIDCDELFSTEILKRIGDIIEGGIGEGKRWAYKFPRINLPWHEGWPDYQVRLMNIKNCTWKGNVHEVVKVLEHPYDIDILREYPIVHKDVKEKKRERNYKWKRIEQKSIVMCSLFRNSVWYMSRFLECIERSIDKIKNMNIERVDLVFIEGNSTDNTWSNLLSWSRVIKDKIKDKSDFKVGVILEKLDINNNIGDRFDKLALLRNMLIKIGLKKHDYVLMIDSDVTWDDDYLIVKLVSDLEKSGSDVIAPLVYVEGYKTFGDTYFYDTLAFNSKNFGKDLGSDSGKDSRFKHYFPYIKGGNDDINKIIKGEFLEVSSVGTCYLLRGEIYNINDLNDFDAMKCYKETNNGKNICMYKGEGVSEQVRFFESARKSGYKILVDSKLKVLHVNLEKHGKRWH